MYGYIYVYMYMHVLYTYIYMYRSSVRARWARVALTMWQTHAHENAHRREEDARRVHRQPLTYQGTHTHIHKMLTYLALGAARGYTQQKPPSDKA